MVTDPRLVHLGWAESSVPVHTHACFYYSDEAALQRSLAFIRTGLDEPGELSVLFADQDRHPSLLSALGEGYPGDLDDHLASGKLVLLGGAPTKEELLTRIAAALDAGIARGHTLIRFLGFIAWGHPGWPGEDDLLEFEAQVNSAVLAYPAVIICTYGVPHLSGRQLVQGGLAAHTVAFLSDAVLPERTFSVVPRTGPDGAGA